MARPVPKKRSFIQRFGDAVTLPEPPEDLSNAMAKAKGEQAYYQNSPSPKSVKKAVARKMGTR